MVERFVQEAFAAKFAARVQSFLPHLLTVRGAERQLCAVAGYRGAGEERLYLESYLDRPIEQVFAAQYGQPIERHQVVEVGNLASSRCRMARQLVAALPAHLMAQGFEWIAFTATLAVRQLLDRFGAPVVDLGPANPAKVSQSGDAWGSYYDHEPRVLAGRLADGLNFSALAKQVAR
jgi:hypothetical protein